MTHYHDTPVREFHEAFGHPVEMRPTAGTDEVRTLRISLLLEELLEFAEACCYSITVKDNKFVMMERINREAPNLNLMADALGDIRYVTDGANLVFGLPGEKILRAIHRSNMSKLGEDGKPIYREDGKVLKGPHYLPPTEEIASILELYKGVNRG